MTYRPSISTSEWLWAAGIVGVLGVWFALTQPVIENGVGFDGANYYAMAAQIQQGQRPEAAAPFVYRVGTPVLSAAAATLTGSPLARSFFATNLLASVIAAFALLFWMRGYIADALARRLILVLFLASPYMPLRFTFHYPVLVDAVAMLGVIIGLITLDWVRESVTLSRVFVAGVIIAVGAVCREIVLVLAVALVFIRPWPVTVDGWLVRSVPLLCGALALAAVRSWVVVTPSTYSIVDTVQYWLRWKTTAQMVMAVLFVAGPAIIVLLNYWRPTWQLAAARPDLVSVTAAFFVLSWIGASDTERVLALAAPVLLMVIGRTFDQLRAQRAHAGLAVIIFLQLLAYRIAFPIGKSITHIALPETGLARRLASLTAYESFFSFSLDRVSLLTLLGANIAAMLLILVTLAVRRYDRPRIRARV